MEFKINWKEMNIIFETAPSNLWEVSIVEEKKVKIEFDFDKLDIKSFKDKLKKWFNKVASYLNKELSYIAYN